MTSGNPTLDKNLECIAKYNPKLKEKLLNLDFVHNYIDLIETELKEPNLSFNGLPLHSQKGAEAEAKALFETLNDTKLTIHISLGIGLGYLFKEICEQTKGKVVLFESNLEILRVTLELVDFSEELSKPNVRVASDIRELRNIFYGIFEYGSKISISSLKPYIAVYGEKEGRELVKSIDETVRGFLSDYAHTKSAYKHLQILLDNFASSLDGPPFSEIQNIYEGKTALVVSAGPTLDLNIETIKKNRDKVVIFCVGTALKALIKNGITPDFLNVLEMNDCSGQISGIDLSDINLILQPTTNNSFFNVKCKRKYLYPCTVNTSGPYWCNKTDVDISNYASSGTVSFDAMNSAKMLGCKRIILVGQDLAFLNNSCYSKNASYSELVFEINPETGKPEYRVTDYESYIKGYVPEGTDTNEQWCKNLAEHKLKALNERVCFVKGVTGEMLPTEWGFSSFIKHFSEYAEKNPQLELINSSMLGAQIDGFNNIPLEKALEDVTSFEHKEIECSHKYNMDKVIEGLEKDKETLQEILGQFETAKLHMHKYEKDLKLRKIITENALTSFGKFLAIYRDIAVKHLSFAEIFHMISIDENTKLRYVVRVTDDPTSEESTRNWAEALKIYYSDLEPKIYTTLDKLDKNIEEIKAKYGGKAEVKA